VRVHVIRPFGRHVVLILMRAVGAGGQIRTPNWNGMLPIDS
jgi:hypothetical protein